MFRSLNALERISQPAGCVAALPEGRAGGHSARCSKGLLDALSLFFLRISVARCALASFVIVALLGTACTSHLPDVPPAEQATGGQKADSVSIGSDSGGAAGQPDPGRQCIISADCAAGAHCDLGECIGRCDTATPCPGGAVCSERGRCVHAGSTVAEPLPSPEKAGELSATPAEVVLTEGDRTLSISLSTTSTEKVSYRVALDAPHLTILEPRGEFEGGTVIELGVDASQVDDFDTPGTVRIITDLGEIVVDAPLRVGLTGRYEGSLRYSLGSVPLGDAQIALDIQEELGDVRVMVDPERSLLFPERDGKATYGEGVYTLSEGLEVTLLHTLGTDAGGARNHFARDIGREVTLRLQPTARGVLEGTFEERIFGVFEQPITASGAVYLRTRPLLEPLEFEAPSYPSMPTVLGGELSMEAFDSLVSVPSIDAAAAVLSTDGCNAGAGTQGCLAEASSFYSSGLNQALDGTVASADPIGDLRETCQSELYLEPVTWAGVSLSGGQCASAAGLLAVLRELALEHSPSATSSASLFHLTLARLLAPHLLIAQDDLVRAVRESFLTGPSGEVATYQAARATLGAPARFLLQPRVLEFLRRTSVEAAKGGSGEAGANATDYPGLRAFGRLLYVLSSIEGELSSLTAADPAQDREGLIRDAQERAVLTTVEAVTLGALVQDWPAIPAGVGTELLGALTPLDRGFRTLLDGAVLFGVPEREIPLAFDPARPEPTNFEQMLDVRAAPALAQQATSQAAFLGATRDFEQSRDALEAELEQVRAGHEGTLAAICGPAFPVAPATEDWELCGADGSGSLAEARLRIELRKAEVRSAFGRIEGIHQRVKIEEQVLFDAGRVRDETLRFVSASGSERMAMAELENIINAAQIALTIASNSSLWNAAAPAAMGVVAGVLETTKGTFEVRREQLTMLQSLKVAEEVEQLEDIQSAARVKTLLIDAAQLELDMEQLDIQLLQELVATTELLDAAKRAALERERVLARIEQRSPGDLLHRTLMHDSLMQALVARREAQRWMYRVGRALEYETNTPLGDALGRSVLAAHSQVEISKLSDCFRSIHGEYALLHGVPQEFKTTVSVREQLGVHGSRTDEVTGEVLDAGRLFREQLLQSQNLDGQGGVEIEFSTNLEPGNGLWSASVCNDKIVSVRAMLVGDFLGDDEAEVDLTVAGGAVLRACAGEEITTWDIDSVDQAIVQAGVNSFGTAAPNGTLHGHAVARPRWRLAIPGPAQAPANGDLDLERIDDVVLEITHAALPLSASASGLPLSCLSTIGSGG